MDTTPINPTESEDTNEYGFTEEDRFDELEEANRALREEQLEMMQLIRDLQTQSMIRNAQNLNPNVTTAAPPNIQVTQVPITTVPAAVAGIATPGRIVTPRSTNFADFFGLNDIRAATDARTDIEVELGGTTLFSGKERDALTLSERAKIYDKATAGIKNSKYKPLIDLNGLESLLTLENIVSFEDLNVELG